MTEAQAQAATAVYGQLVAARKELAQLRAIRPLLSGVTLHAGPGVAPVRIQGVQAERLTCAANAAEVLLVSRMTTLEKELIEL
jgi:hypothetical protein